VKKLSQTGFTLIELLLVISIIAMLAAMLFPVLSSVKRASKGTVCAAQLHSIGLAIDMYAADWDQLYPYGTDGQSKVNPLVGSDETAAQIQALPLLNGILATYERDPNIWRCPVDNGSIGTGPSNGSTLFAQFGGSYWFQSLLAISHVSDPAEGISDSTGNPSYGSSQIIILRDWSPFWHLNSGSTHMTPDTERYTALYADDHIKSVGLYGEVLGTAVSFD
jgi:prepilin-type N-terminal cleavage/methylation domain-containing protein